MLWVLTWIGRIKFTNILPTHFETLNILHMASMDFFDSDMYNRTNTGVHFDGKGGNIYLRLRGRSNTIYATQVGCSRGCSGSQKVGARKIVRCHFQVPFLKFRSQFKSQLKILQGATFFEPKLWMINRLHVPGMFSFMYRYKWSRFVCTNVNVYIVLLFFISISSSKTKRFI